MSEPTPRPWRYEWNEAQGESGYDILGPADEPIAGISDAVAGPLEANAALIIRACNSHDEMVAVLEAWEQWFRQGTKAPLYRSGKALFKAHE